jgi:hypothetical protein
MRFKLTLSILILLLASACSKITTVRQNVSFNSQDLKQSEISILPSNAIVYSVSGFGSKERVVDYEYYMEELLNRTLISNLEKSGYKVSFLSNKDLYDQKISNQVLELKNRYDISMKELYAQSYMQEEQALAIINNIDNKLTKLTMDPNKKYLILSSYASSHQTNGARVTGFLIDALIGTRLSADADKSVLIIGIVDINTGDILWSNLSSDVSDAFSSSFKRITNSDDKIDEEKTDKLVSRVLDPLINPKIK